MQCLKLIKKHELGSIKRVNVHCSSPLDPRPAEGYLFFGVYMIVYKNRDFYALYVTYKKMCFSLLRVEVNTGHIAQKTFRTSLLAQVLECSHNS